MSARLKIAISAAAHGLVLDLAGTEFCDASGLPFTIAGALRQGLPGPRPG